MNTILLVLFTVITSFVFGHFAAYAVHRMLHTQLFKGLAKSHNVHHDLYPVDDFESEAYRSAEADDSSFVFLPILTMAMMGFFLPIAWLTGAWWIYVIVIGEGIMFGILNDRLHDAFHIKEHWLNRYTWFRKLKEIHWHHHATPETNHGIIWFIPDKVFKTFKS
jgi:hypothetical protein